MIDVKVNKPVSQLELDNICKKVSDAIIISMAKAVGGSVLHNDDTMTKIIDGKPIRKKCVGRKDWSHDWIENVKKEDIDTRFFNLDYTRK